MSDYNARIAAQPEASREEALVELTEGGAKQSYASGWRLRTMQVVLLLTILAVWELAAGDKRHETVLIDRFWISQPSEIGEKLLHWISDGSLWFHLSITLRGMFSGYVLGAVIGLTLGFILGRSVMLARLLDPFIISLYSIPKLALGPLFILWFGIGLEPKIVLVTVSVFFLVFLNTYAGVRSVGEELVDIVRLMGASRRDVITKVVLPSSMSWILTGLKLAVPYSLVAAVVGEMMASNKGIGYLLIHSQAQFDTAGVFAAIALLMFFGLILNGAVNRAEKHLLRWRSAGRK